MIGQSEKYTKGEINRLGNQIRDNFNSPNESIIQDLENYRTSYKSSIAKAFKEICQLKYKVNSTTIVTYRIKRFESIINKLHRFPKMKFSRMWDIAGCRCIVNNNEDVYKLRDELKTIMEFKKETDYLVKPRETGYRSLHIYAKFPKEDNIIEIQIRTQEDHNWATLVEISDLLYESGLKEYQYDKDLLEFHKLLSKKGDLNFIEKKKIADTIKKYDYVDKLSKVFTQNHLKVREQWLNIENKSRHRYFLIETTKNEVPKIEAFNNFNEAEEKYFEKYKDNQSANIVLTHLPKPRYNQISVAYSNYILTMHSFENDSSLIFEDLIIESLKKERYWDFFKYQDYYQNITLNRVTNWIKEIVYCERTLSEKTKKHRKKIQKKEQEWKSDIEKELKGGIKKMELFQEKLQKNIPQKFLKKTVIKIMINRVTKKYRKKLKRELEKI